MSPGDSSGWTARYRSVLGPARGVQWVRWAWLRWLGFVFASAFVALVVQWNALNGPQGILPAHDLLAAVAAGHGWLQRALLVPSLLWVSSGAAAIHILAWLGLAASVALFFNLWPRASIAVCTVCFLSFLAAARDFASYQSDGMLMTAGLISLFFAPPLRRTWKIWADIDVPGPSWISLLSLRWLWFTVYFDSGVVKLMSGDTQWRHLTAMDAYYENGPLPTWIGWYAQKLPHAFHAATAASVLVIELGLSWFAWLPRRFRIVLFWVVTPLQIGIILTANYGFLNYIMLALGFTLLDDRHLGWLFGPVRRRLRWPAAARRGATVEMQPPGWRATLAGAALLALFAVTFCQTLRRVWPRSPFGLTAIRALEPFRIADGYGLFAVMTTQRLEIEFQGSNDGVNWVAYPYRYKPQDPDRAPGVYAPYQPRFDWNLWFASLGTWYEYRFVVNVERDLLRNDRAVLGLFAGNPFSGKPPAEVRAVLWQYWFSSADEHRASGAWWRREPRDLYAPDLELRPDGSVGLVALPSSQPHIPVIGGFKVPK